MLKNELPLISIITVVYNGESYLEKTIQSVIRQKYASIEYIIVDGGSTDKTLEIIKKHEVNISKFISEPDNGIYDAMNKGLSMATGDWVNFLNGGDYFHDENVLNILFAKDRLDCWLFVYGDSINISNTFQKYIKANKLSRKSIKYSLGLCHQAVFVKRDRAPFYNINYKYKAEYNWVIDIILSIPESTIKYFPIPLVYYSLGGFSERGMLKNLQEFILTTKKRFGVGQVALNAFIYLKVLLRHFKYSVRNKISKSQ